ncbi:hypothetical protein [Hymenobacter fodinae]|uniref:Uncharacterized protein n=1 Tax=Hymenobacter fodinae TaxID=2510796 RepID=A0A4Z0P6Z0_9BACT|nr:hypothetical protein [Hymenobacter fodinae]TGE07685.1 hypothetical protein EU556_07985 [Hymenobacter fodinae]
MLFIQKLFGRKKPTIHSLVFETFGWSERQASAELREWQHPSIPALLSLHFFDIPPDLPPAADEVKLRQKYRQSLIQQEGGILEVTRSAIEGAPLIRTLFKLPTNSNGVLYAGSLTIPFKSCSYVIKVQARESGVTGMREAVVANMLLGTDQLKIGDDGFIGWAADPYEPTFTAGKLMNLAERPEYDIQFPNHPLTLVRQTLRAIETQIHLPPERIEALPFV